MADTSNVTNRKTVRSEFITALETTFGPAGATKLVAEFYNGQPKDPAGASPFIWISSGPTDRTTATASTRKRSFIQLLLGVAIRLDGTKDEEWVENRLDDIEKALADWVLDSDNWSDPFSWDWVEFASASAPGYQHMGGHEYRIEIQAIQMRVSDE